MDNFDPTYGDEGTSRADDLFASHNHKEDREITLVTGQNLTRGAVLGKITASGKYTLSLAAAVDGSEVPVAILGQDTDASAADKVTFAYEKGTFNERALTLGAGHTLDSIRAGLRDLGIFMHDSVAR